MEILKETWKELTGTGSTIFLSAMSLIHHAGELLPVASAGLAFVTGIYSIVLIRAKIKTEELKHQKLEQDEEESE